MPVQDTKSHSSSSVTRPLCMTNFRQWSRSTWMNSASNSCSVYQAPPVSSLLGSSSYSMYTLRFLEATDLTALMSLRISRIFSTLDICTCERLLLLRRSLVQIPVVLAFLISWYTSRSSWVHPFSLMTFSSLTSLYTSLSPSWKSSMRLLVSSPFIATTRSETGTPTSSFSRSSSCSPSGLARHISKMASSRCVADVAMILLAPDETGKVEARRCARRGIQNQQQWCL
mmetsp:Transcript_19379/g.42418  ORF Transcript_19379/g.42418 Transcript_19379/m.42418 type:complete len:228 (+) Transcript_19379:657-1340(+)